MNKFYFEIYIQLNIKMGFSNEEFNNLLKFLNNESQRGTFILDEFVVIGSFWEELKKNVKDENYDLELKQLDILVRILNACLNRKGNDPDVLRTILALLDKAQTLQEVAKTAETEQPKVEELKA